MLPNNALSNTPLPAPFLAPRTAVRFDATHGLTDTHLGGVALGDASQGISYQLWSARADGANVYLSAPNTPEFVALPNVNAVWVALAIDQSAREFVAYADSNGNASYYWYDTTILAYRTSALAGVIPRVFAALDDSRPIEIGSSDVILAYERAGHLYFRQQRDRFGTEYDLGAVPGISPSTLVQIGMNAKLRFQFAFQGVQIAGLPPGELTEAA